MGEIGVIVNPMAGKDIRRLAGYASTVNTMEKIEVVRRILAGLLFFDVNRILFMPDPSNLTERVINTLNREDQEKLKEKVCILNFSPLGDVEDTINAAIIMDRLGVDCIITLGGDGTCKAVASNCGKTAMLPISTGTNNVFPYHIDGTVAGLVAGAFGTILPEKESLILNSNMFNIYLNQNLVEHALIDVTLYNEPFINARAVWEPEKILYVAISRHIEGPVIGLSSIAQIAQVGQGISSSGFACTIGPDNTDSTIVCQIVPGVLKKIPISRMEKIIPGHKYEVRTNQPARWCTVALDGEREMEVDLFKDKIEIEILENSVRIIDPWRTYSEMLKNRVFNI